MSTRVHARFVGSVANRPEIHRVFRGHDGPVYNELYNHYGMRVLTASRTLVGVRTGRLIASIHREAGENALGLYVDVVAGIPGLTTYLGYHHDGTPAHEIRPRRRKVLRFIWHGRVVYARRVHHPGTRGTHFLTRALDALR